MQLLLDIELKVIVGSSLKIFLFIGQETIKKLG